MASYELEVDTEVFATEKYPKEHERGSVGKSLANHCDLSN